MSYVVRFDDIGEARIMREDELTPVYTHLERPEPPENDLVDDWGRIKRKDIPFKHPHKKSGPFKVHGSFHKGPETEVTHPGNFVEGLTLPFVEAKKGM